MKTEWNWEKKAAKLKGRSKGDLVCIGYVYMHADEAEGCMILNQEIDGWSPLMKADVLKDVQYDAEALYEKAVAEMGGDNGY